MNETPRRGTPAARVLDQAFDLIFDVGPVGVATVDPQLRIERANPRFCEMVGYSEEELRRLTFADITHPDDVARNVAMARDSFAGGPSHYTIEKRYLTRSGETVWARVTALFVRDEDGTPVYGLALIEDITDRKRSEAEIRALNAELEGRVAQLEATNEALKRANEELDTFSANVSHDLKSPLVTVAQFSQMLLEGERGPLAEGQAELVRRVRNAGLQAMHIIDDLRDLADVTRREIFAEEIDLSAMTWRIVDELTALDPERSIHFEVRPDLRAYGDPALVRLLMVNLLQNAWKYTRPAEKARVEVGAEAGPVRTVFYVRDNGVGFDNAHRERIFQAFERLRPEEFSGTGLGLATARRIVQRHGGSIWAEGEPGRGATFRFTL